MPDYSRGKIYKITSGDLTYIGATTEPTLARRLSGHRSDYKSWKNGGRRGCSSFSLIETGQYEITLIELYPCNSKDELSARERFHIETNVCVNKCIPNRTDAEYREENRVIIREKALKTRQDNPDKIKEYNKAWYYSNQDKIVAKGKRYYEKNKDKIKERQSHRNGQNHGETVLTDYQGQEAETK